VTASFADNEIWHVLIDADDMKRMNVEQLDDAFRLSLVDASTLVWKAGMKTWQRLGAVAGIDSDDGKSHAPPPPPAPRPAPAATHHQQTVHHAHAFQQQQALQRQQQAALQQQAIQQQALQQRAIQQQQALQALQQQKQAYQQHLEQQRAHQEQAAYHGRQAQAYQAQIARHTQAAQTAALARTVPVAHAFATTQPSMARTADPFALAKPRVALSSEVDFRRSARGGVRWGRWSLGVLLLAVATVGAYRQNLLRGGARLIGLERQYLASEWRTTAYLTAKAPYGARAVLTQLKLLPGPNALPPVALAPASPPKPVATPAPVPAEPVVTPPSNPSDVKTVSLDSLPALAGAAAKVDPPTEPAPKAVAAQVAPERAERRAVKAERSAPPPRAEKPAPVARSEQPKPEKAKPEPKPRAEPPPPANESFLNSAIRSAIAADKAGKKK
jgi:hypothetical protein